MFIKLETEFITNELPEELTLDVDGNPKEPTDAELLEEGWYRFTIEPMPPAAPNDTVTYARTTDGADCLQSWIVTPPTAEQTEALLAAAKATKAQEIKAERDRRRFEGGVKVAQCWFKSDNQAVGEYTAMATLGAAIPESTVLREAWRTMHPSTTIQMTPALAKQILFAGFSSIAAIDDAAIVHLTALSASLNPESYDFSTGWPLTYQESA